MKCPLLQPVSLLPTTLAEYETALPELGRERVLQIFREVETAKEVKLGLCREFRQQLIWEEDGETLLAACLNGSDTTFCVPRVRGRAAPRPGCGLAAAEAVLPLAHRGACGRGRGQGLRPRHQQLGHRLRLPGDRQVRTQAEYYCSSSSLSPDHNE